MRLTKIALGVAVGIGGAAAANAADVAMFPYIVNSGSVTTIVSIIDRGDGETTKRYDEYAEPTVDGNFLHWRLHYKSGSNSGNEKGCRKTDTYLSTAPNDIQTIDLSNWMSDPRNAELIEDAQSQGMSPDDIDNLLDEAGFFSLDDPSLGVLFEDPNTQSQNNQWYQDGYNYGLVSEALGGRNGLLLRGILFVHNSDDQIHDTGVTAGGTVKGEAMVFEFDGGAAWGYIAEAKDGGNTDDKTDFSFSDRAAGTRGIPLVPFMPLNDVTTALVVTPVDENGQGMLDQGGDDVAGWQRLSVTVGLRADNPLTIRDVAGNENPDIGVAFDRDGNMVMGAVDQTITCVGVVHVKNMLTQAAQQELVAGGYGLLSISQGSDSNTPGHAIVYKLEYATDEQRPFPVNDLTITFNNGMKL